MDIPMDFNSKWDLSDVVLIAEDAEGNEKELHVNKAYLATFSSVFKRMFFSSFKEANSESVKVSCSYEMMKLILEIIYRQSRDICIRSQTLGIGVLPKLYETADYFDFPLIRTLCIQQMISQPSLEMTTAVLSIASIENGLHALLMTILEKLNPDDIKKFLSAEDSQLMFSKKDVRRIYEWIAKKKLPKPVILYTSWATRRFISDLSENCKNAPVDCTQKWPRSDVVFKTKNSDGKKLFSNKTVLAMVSSHFANLFFGSPEMETANLTEIEVNVDYMIMKNILSIVHHSFDIHNNRMRSFLVYNMYLVASKESLDISLIRNICVKWMMEKATHCLWEMATSLKLDVDERLLILNKMDADELRSWLFNCSDTVSPDFFTNDDDFVDKYMAHYASEKKPIVSTTEVGIIVEKLISSNDEEDYDEDDEDEEEYDEDEEEEDSDDEEEDDDDDEDSSDEETE